MFKSGMRRRGFTLPEVLVTVAIVAVLAAIVVPTVTNQIGKGDDTNLATNVSSLRSSVTAFVSDVRKFPRRLQNLIEKPASTDDDVTGGDFGASAVARWKGPYLPSTLKSYVSNNLIDSLSWGGLAYVLDSLSDTSFTASGGDGTDGYIGLTFAGVTSTATALRIDSIIDGATGRIDGNLRWNQVGVPLSPLNGRLTLLLIGR